MVARRRHRGRVPGLAALCVAITAGAWVLAMVVNRRVTGTVLALPPDRPSGSVKATVAPRVSLLRHPQAAPMRLDDRTADREPHAHPVLLGREEGLEDALGVLKPVPASRNSTRIASSPSLHERIWSDARRRPRRPSPRYRSDQVHEHLLHLNAIERDRGRSARDSSSMRMSFAAISSAISRQTS